MLKSILFGKWGDHWQPTLVWRLFYRLKALLCFILNRDPGCDVNVYDPTHVLLTYTGGGSGWSEYGTNYWFEAIGVGGGVFGNWWVTYFEGSSD